MLFAYLNEEQQGPMYRYSIDNAVTFSSDDLVLFRESPFASWMERLTLENPAHGIPPDVGIEPPPSYYKPQNVFAATLRSSGRQFVQIDWDMDERKRRSATLEAMRLGADFIVDGQLAVGPLAGPVNLLTRTSGFSELGQYLYMPCDTQGDTSIHASFRLCFLADLLHSMQGQLPPQMLAIRDSARLSPLRTEEFIYLYRAVKQRFMLAQRDFRKHRMPDPAESSHCGRWNDCASEVIRERILNKGARSESEAIFEAEIPQSSEPGSAAGNSVGRYDLDSLPQRPVLNKGSGTLAQQARHLSAQGKALSGFTERRGEVASAQLEPLSFIADFSQSESTLFSLQSAPDQSSNDGGTVEADPAAEAGSFAESLQATKPYAWTVDRSKDSTFPSGDSPHPLDSPGFNISAHSRVYKRSAPVTPTETTVDAATYELNESIDTGPEISRSTFSNQLNTSESIDT